MRIRRETLLQTVLPAALMLCLTPMPAQACADILAGFAILTVPMLLPVTLVVFFGLKGTSIAWRAGLLGLSLPLTFALTFMCYGILMDTHGLHGHIAPSVIVGAVPFIGPPAWIYASSQPKDSKVAKAWAFTQRAVCIVVLAIVGVCAGIVLFGSVV